MKPVNIYALTRISNPYDISRLDRQMSNRKRFLNIKEQEIEGLRMLSRHLCKQMPCGSELFFYYSFQIPKLGKEFDLLRISENMVLNIELKSENVSLERIKKQLVQNCYYLTNIGLPIKSYTYVSSIDKLYRLTSGGNLIEADWMRLCDDLEKQNNIYDDDIELLFNEENYLISPLTDPERFLQREYFLTSQQKDIRDGILSSIKQNKYKIMTFTGLPGTGKTLLLYDLAMALSAKQRVCVLHFGSFPDELKFLNERLKRIDFYKCKDIRDIPCFNDYLAVLIDEGHRMDACIFDEIVSQAASLNIPLVISMDYEEAIAQSQRPFSPLLAYKNNDVCKFYKLTNRIRLNSELSNFIHCLMQRDGTHRRKSYSSISVYYARSKEEAINFIHMFKKASYTYIREDEYDFYPDNNELEINASDATCREFEKVLVLIGNEVTYNDDGSLVSKSITGDNLVRNIFHGLNRAKKQIGIVVYNNPEVFKAILDILQGK